MSIYYLASFTVVQTKKCALLISSLTLAVVTADTTNGEITGQSNFEIEGSAGYKSIQTDFPLKISNRKISGSIGTGEDEIIIDTNSEIDIYHNP